MQYGITLPGRGPLATPDNMATIAQKAEAPGFDSIALGDHILVPKSIDSDYPYTETGEFPGSASGQAMEQITALRTKSMEGYQEKDPDAVQEHLKASGQLGGAMRFRASDKAKALYLAPLKARAASASHPSHPRISLKSSLRRTQAASGWK